MDVRKEEGKKEEKKYNDDERYYNHNNNTHTVSPTSSLYCGIKILRPLSLSEKQRVKINRVTSRKKHHDLLMCVCPEEAEESSQAPLAGHHHVVLGQLFRCFHDLLRERERDAPCKKSQGYLVKEEMLYGMLREMRREELQGSKGRMRR